jgi:hypothetical protein
MQIRLVGNCKKWLDTSLEQCRDRDGTQILNLGSYRQERVFKQSFKKYLNICLFLLILREYSRQPAENVCSTNGSINFNEYFRQNNRTHLSNVLAQIRQQGQNRDQEGCHVWRLEVWHWQSELLTLKSWTKDFHNCHLAWESLPDYGTEHWTKECQGCWMTEENRTDTLLN